MFLTESGSPGPTAIRVLHRDPVAQYAEAKKLPADFLNGLGVTDGKQKGPVVRISYMDADGEEAAIRWRVALDGDIRFKWAFGAKPLLYGLWRLDHTSDMVVVVEGESDAHTLWYHGINAVGVPGAGQWNEARDAEHLDGFEQVVLVVEPDRGGETLLRHLAGSKLRDRLFLVYPDDDLSAVHLVGPESFRDRWEALLKAGEPFHQYTERLAQEEAAEAWPRCQELAESPEILPLLVRDIRGLGVVGEDLAVQLIYLLLTSRLLDKPVSGVVKGPSSGGKSYVVACVLDLFPESAAHQLSGMSERALAYGEEPLSHRHLVVYEAAGLNSEFGSYLIRSLLSEGRVRYETTEKGADGTFHVRLIEREGPTGLLVTTTQVALHPENETRLLSIPVDDSRAQTAAVLRALADENRPAVNVDRWRDLQTWLQYGVHRVTIPYAPLLAEYTPPVAVRLRRDFEATLTLIRAHALLHRENRDRDNNGRIVATLDDYRTVRGLVNGLMSDSVEATVSPTVRQTVETVERLLVLNGDRHPVSVAQLKEALDLDHSTAYRRAREALERGYLVNKETVPRRPYRLSLGDKLPEDVPLLPDPDHYPWDLSHCTDCALTGGIQDTDTGPDTAEADDPAALPDLLGADFVGPPPSP